MYVYVGLMHVSPLRAALFLQWGIQGYQQKVPQAKWTLVWKQRESEERMIRRGRELKRTRMKYDTEDRLRGNKEKTK